MNSSDAPSLTAADPVTRETQRLIRTFFRGRFGIVIIMALAFAVFAIWDPVPWKLWWIGVTAFLMVALSAVEYWRTRRSFAGPRTVQVNLAGVLLLQGSMIYVTGGIESPILPIFLPLAFATGLSLGSIRLALPVMAIPLSALLLFASGALGGWLPRATPAFFGLGAGFWNVPVYVWIRAALVGGIFIATTLVGIVIRSLYQRIVFQVDDARRETLAALTNRNQEVLSVSSTVAHELKNPLSSIQGLTQLMLHTVPAESKDSERLNVMLREIVRMRTVLDEFRAFSRPLSGLRVERAELLDLIRDLILLSEGHAGTRRISLRALEQPITVSCDPQKVKQALLNLLQNSIDATPAEGRIDIEVSAPEAERVKITLHDSGPGLAPEIASRLFTPGHTTKQRGTGIGLVVARSIAEQHGGTLTVENSASGGCLATLTLPLEARTREEDAW